MTQSFIEGWVCMCLPCTAGWNGGTIYAYHNCVIRSDYKPLHCLEFLKNNRFGENDASIIYWEQKWLNLMKDIKYYKFMMMNMKAVVQLLWRTKKCFSYQP